MKFFLVFSEFSDKRHNYFHTFLTCNAEKCISIYITLHFATNTSAFIFLIFKYTQTHNSSVRCVYSAFKNQETL